MLTLVSATRLSEQAFHRVSLLGPCMPRLGEFGPVALRLAHGNTRPLAEVYNEAIEAAAPDDVLVFVHDDVRVDDWMLGQRLQEALQHFDVVGVAGNTRVQDHQVAWYLQPERPGVPSPWDREHLSGAIGHGSPRSRITMYGPSPQAVRLLDGVFLAVRAGCLQQSGVRFDPTLAFHFYDLDFCLQAHRAGLRLGTWPIAITHASGGESIQTQSWADARLVFLKKWFADCHGPAALAMTSEACGPRNGA